MMSLTFIDNFLNKITMYRLVFYLLVFYLAVAFVLSFLNLLPFKLINLLFSAVFITGICWLTNKIFAKLFNAPTNLESVYITALILSLIITPINSLDKAAYLAVVGILAISSKYILAINKKHIFNPAASAVFISGLLLKFGASWWIGNLYMLIPVLIGGFLVVRKVQRFSLVLSFLSFYLIFIIGNSIRTGNILTASIFLESPVFFFYFIMLTEPQTTPPAKNLQILYGGLVGLLSSFLSLESSLILGNIFSYIVSPKEKLFLKLKEKIQLTQDTYNFTFRLDKPLKYNAGQYMEWTLSQKRPDLRGNRRFFTLASSPTEDSLNIGVKLSPSGSSFK